MKVAKNESRSFLKTGLFEARILAVNPSREELNKLLGKEATDDQKELEYVYQKEDKNHVRIVFWVEDVITGWKTKLEFDITDEEATTKAGNPIWVNQVGENAKVAKENLQKWFMEFYKSKDDKTVIGEKTFWKSKVGEAPMYEFIRNWMSRKNSSGYDIVNWWIPATDIHMDIKKLFRGNVDELRKILKDEDEVTSTVVLAAWVDSYEKDDELKHAQKVWVYKTAPGSLMKKIRLAISNNSWEASKDTDKFRKELTGEYGIKKGFYLGELKDFDPSEHLEATNNVIQHSNDGEVSMDYDV